MQKTNSPPMSHYFISDLHLEESRPEITGAFLELMERISADAQALYILGDFFESWIGDDENTELQQQIKAHLKTFTDSGSELYLMAGNRDFLIGSQFAEETGATLLTDPSLINLNGEPVLLMHGDSLCTHDIGYMKFRKTIRNPAFLEPFLKRPLAERRITAQQLRAMSQANNQTKASEIMDVTPEEVVSVMSEFKVRTLIHGHTHRPKRHPLELAHGTAERIVLGDWDSHVWYLQVTEDGAKQLLSYLIPKRS